MRPQRNYRRRRREERASRARGRELLDCESSNGGINSLRHGPDSKEEEEEGDDDKEKKRERKKEG